MRKAADLLSVSGCPDGFRILFHFHAIHKAQAIRLDLKQRIDISLGVIELPEQFLLRIRQRAF